ncbi:hypothetical protein CHS0354_039978 [Potamilus streckersoni]|uniref:Protein FAM47E n=1 Tax=Potamilus streckersoni TaxID=2493646 RepID=A0AAE0S0R4_9BIVA|nr:hypothetical protein CHS0354_039978 [Potamilus streckersoni]
MAMAELKYDLALVNTKTDKKIRLQPWYKERLRTKHIKSVKPGDNSKNLEGRNWLFLKDGLDDFRDGLPPPVQGNIMIKGPKGPGPNIVGNSENVGSVKQPAVRKRFSKQQVCYARSTPIQQQRRDHIDEIEYGLTQHPLALYPHLEESVEPELFEDIVDILDPEMNLADTPDGSLPEMQEEENEDAFEKSEHASTKQDNKEELDQIEQIRNLYRWKEKDKKDKKKTGLEKPSDSSQDEHIKLVTKEFCDWVAGLGGESNNIEESTITSLFASGYETKPALSVPIHVVELTNVPPELRSSATVPPQQQSAKNLPENKAKTKNWRSRELVYSGNYEPSWVKFKYGAWYLDPKTWQKRDYDEDLVDPKEIKDKETSETKQKSHELNSELSIMHGSQAFMEFMDKKTGTRRPKFLDEILEIQQKAAEEERRRQEAEQAAKQKRLHNKKKDSAQDASSEGKS